MHDSTLKTISFEFYRELLRVFPKSNFKFQEAHVPARFAIKHYVGRRASSCNHIVFIEDVVLVWPYNGSGIQNFTVELCDPDCFDKIIKLLRCLNE